MYTLGIDIGTTTIKVCIVEQRVILKSHSLKHKSDILFNDESSKHYSEQDPVKIIHTLDECLHEVLYDLPNVAKIAITGQMHGVLLWKATIPEKLNYPNLFSVFNNTVLKSTNLITWQDQRCDKEFLKSLPSSPSHCNLSTGYGIATMIWLNKNNANPTDEFDYCGTIMDFIVWMFTQCEAVVTSSHNACSWGYYDIESSQWEVEQLN